MDETRAALLRSTTSLKPSLAAPRSARRAHCRLGLDGQEALALQLLAGKFPRPTHRLGLFSRPFFRRLLVMAPELHLAENALALHLLLERLEGLIDIIVADENLHASSFSVRSSRGANYLLGEWGSGAG